MNEPARTQWQIRCAFNGYCKRALKNEAANAHRDTKRQQLREVTFSDLSPQEENQLYTHDLYFADDEAEKAFCVAGKEISAKLLAEAMHSLPEEKRKAVLLYYFFDMSDVEIAEPEHNRLYVFVGKESLASVGCRSKKNVYKAQFYSAEEIMELFDAVEGDPLEICVKLAAYYGLRRSEVLGLKWDAINLEQKTISIKHKVIEETVDGRSVAVGEDVLKTKSSFRTLPLLPSVEKLLLAEKEKQEMYRKLFKRSYCRDYLDYICLDQAGKLMRPNYVTEHFSWLLEKNGLKKIRFHDLRHSCASLLLASGIAMKQIQIWLGHSTFSTTADIYSHLDFHAQIESGLVMDGMFDRTPVDEPTGLEEDE